MKDLVDRFLKQQSGNKPTIVDAGLVDDQTESTFAMDAPPSKELIRIAKTSLRRMYQPGSRAKIAAYWSGVTGQARLLQYALELAQTEYREGFVFAGYLGPEREHVVNKANVSWVPVQLAPLLTGRSCNIKKCDLPFGLGAGRYDYSYRDLDGNRHRGTDPYALHLAFIAERRQVLANWVEGDVGPKTKRLLAARVARIDAIVASGQEVEYI